MVPKSVRFNHILPFHRLILFIEITLSLTDGEMNNLAVRSF